MLLNFLQYLSSYLHHVLLCSAIFSMLIFLGVYSSYLVSLVCQCFFCGMDQLFGLAQQTLSQAYNINKKEKILSYTLEYIFCEMFK